MPRVKQASKQKRTNKAGAVKVLGAAGLGSFAGGQCIRIHDAHCRYPAI
jgi:hypothetical protein